MRVARAFNDEDHARYEKLLAEMKAERAARPRAKLFGARISEDFGETWKLKSLCAECVRAKNFEPPTMVKNEGLSATQTCDECGAINEMFGD